MDTVHFNEHIERMSKTPMDRLGLGGGFDRHFYGNMDPKEYSENIPVVKEFFEINPQFHGGRAKYLKCCKPGLEFFFPRPTLFKDGAHYKAFRKLLLDNGFDHHHWLVLFPERVSVTDRPDFFFSLDLVGVENFISLPIDRVFDIHRSCQPYYALIRLLEGQLPSHSILVKDVLRIGESMLEKALQEGKKGKEILGILMPMQKKLGKYGLNESHGSFMGINLKELIPTYTIV